MEIDSMLERKARGECPFCHSVIDIEDFRDEIDRKEFEISGLCQQCQDEIFEKGE